MTIRTPEVRLVELDARARQALTRHHPELAGYAALVVATKPDGRTKVFEVVRRAVDAVVAAQRDQLEKLVARLSLALPGPAAPLGVQARHQAQFRARVMADFGAYRATDLAARSRSNARNRSQLAYSWRREGRIFSVPYQGRDWYLAFQFDEEARPLPAVAGVLEQLHDLDPWDIAAWFVRAHPHLDRRRPVDLLADDADGVIAAARRDAVAMSPPSRATGSG